MVSPTSIPNGLRIAVYNAMGGWGPYSVREICELFEMHGFTQTADVGDIGGERRSAAESYQQAIDWGDPDQRRRYLMVVEEVLEHYPDDDDGKTPQLARNVHRALKFVGVALPSVEPVLHESGDDLWRPAGAPRIFVSHLAQRREEVHHLASMLRVIGFACFVAHDAIEPSRSWQREIERALRSCDILVAYITPGFHDSKWTDQEVGWALGRGLVAIPIAVEGENPYGFLGEYQAVRYLSEDSAAQLSRRVFRAIADAIFQSQRAGASALTDRVAPLVAQAFSRASTPATATFWFEMLVQVPASAWTRGMGHAVRECLEQNIAVAEAMVFGTESEALRPAVEALLRERQVT